MSTLLPPPRSDQERRSLPFLLLLAVPLVLAAAGCGRQAPLLDNQPIVAYSTPLGENPSVDLVLSALGALRDPTTGFGGQKIIPWSLGAPGSTFVDGRTGEPISQGYVLMPAGVEFSENAFDGIGLSGTEKSAWIFVPGYLPESIPVGALVGLESANVEFTRTLYGANIGGVWGSASDWAPKSPGPPAGALHQTQYEDFREALGRRGYRIGGMEVLHQFLDDPSQVPIRTVVVTGYESTERRLFEVESPLLSGFYAAGLPAQTLLPSDTLEAMLLKAGALTAPVPEDPLIVDNDHAKFTARGPWEVRANGRQTSTYGLDALVTSDPEAEAAWVVEGLRQGRHATWLHWDHRITQSKKALLEIGLVEQGVALVTWEIDMTNGTGGWNRLGDWVAISARPLFVRIRSGDGRVVMADAIKFQPLQDEVAP